MAVSRALRFQILRRDNHACRYCGGAAPDVKLTIDHVVPTALGGTDTPDNLVTACEACNGGKSATPPDAERVAEVSADALRWANAMRVAADEALANRAIVQQRYDEFESRWNEFGIGEGNRRRPVPLPPDWRTSVERFLAAGLPLPLLLDCIDPAMTAQKVPADRRFNYMCAVAWRMVGELQDRAGNLVGADEPVGPNLDTRAALAQELLNDMFEDRDREAARAELAKAEARGELDDNPPEVSELIYLIDGLLGEVTVWEYVSGKFLRGLPKWLLDQAADEVEENYRKAGEELPISRSEITSQLIGTIGRILSECTITRPES